VVRWSAGAVNGPWFGVRDRGTGTGPAVG